MNAAQHFPTLQCPHDYDILYSYHDNGVVSCVQAFDSSKNVWINIWKKFYHDGSRSEVASWDAKKRQGMLLSWYENGATKEETPFVSLEAPYVIHGAVITYDKTGYVTYVSEFANGTEHGVALHYDKDVLIGHANYHNGVNTLKRLWNTSGQLIYEHGSTKRRWSSEGELEIDESPGLSGSEGHYAFRSWTGCEKMIFPACNKMR